MPNDARTHARRLHRRLVGARTAAGGLRACLAAAQREAAKGDLRRPRLGIIGSPMCFELDSLPPIPVIRGAAVSHDDLVLEARDGNRFAAFAATPDEPTRRRRRHPPGRPRALPLLRGARAALRRARLRRGRVRLLRPHRRRREARRRLRVHGARRADDAGGRPGRRRRRRRVPARRRRRRDLHGRLLLRRPQLVARGGRRPRPRRRDRLLRPAGERGRRRRARPSAPASSRRRSSRSRPAPTRTSPPRTTRPSTQALTAAGVEHEVVTYDGAPHSFFDRKQEEFADAPRTPGSACSRSSSATRKPRRAPRAARRARERSPGARPGAGS